MNIVSVIITIILLAFFLGSLLIILRYLRINFTNPRGRGAQKKTGRILKRYASVRNYKVLSNLTMEQDGQILQIEHALVGFFGILFVHTCGARGEYYGRIDNPEWVFVLDSKKNPDQKEALQNPLYIQQQAIHGIRRELAKEKLYNVTMEQAVVVSNPSKKTAVYITQQDTIFTTKEFKSYLRRVKFDKDNDVNVEKVAGILQQYSSRNTAKTP